MADMEEGADTTEPDEKSEKIVEGDVLQAQAFKGWPLFLLTCQAVGAIFGDIGTSPLYVYSSTFTAPPTRDQIICAASLIIWSLTLMVSIKYVCLVVRADDNGQGGTLALYSLLQRYSNIAQTDPARPNQVARYKTNDLRRDNQKFRSWLESSVVSQRLLTGMGLFGVCFVLSDGILTPAQSVLGAVQGTTIVNPNLGTWTVVGITIAILVLLFAVQPLGLGRLSFFFSPVVAFWLLLNLCFGIYNLAKYDTGVFRAFSPHFAGKWFTLDFGDGTSGWHRLAGILLCFTGCEALYADMSAFSRSAVQLSWLVFAMPCLVFAYLGQAAYISVHPEAYLNPFFLTLPKGWLWPSLISAVLAAIVASQALITGAFAILQQAINISYFPRLTIHHTSRRVHGQIYIGVANWTLMILCIVVVCAYNNTTRLGNAYGLVVVACTFITTCLMGVAGIVVFKLHPLIVFPVWLIFACLDGLYLSAALFKVPKGAYFTLITSGLLAAIMICWRWGKGRQWRQARRDRMITSDVVEESTKEVLALTKEFGGESLAIIKGIGIFFDEFPNGAPPVWIRFVTTFAATHEITLFAHLRQVYAPRVAEEDRFEFHRTSIRNVYRVIVRFGYDDRVSTATMQDFAGPLHQWLAATLHRLSAASPEAAAIDADLLTLLRASDRHNLVAFILDKTELRTASRNYVVKLMHGAFCFLRDNTRSRPSFWRLPADKLIELGGIREI